MKIGAISLGCDKNRVDTEKMLARLVSGGHTLVGNEEDADVIIVNTCAFTDDAKSEAIDEILSAVGLIFSFFLAFTTALSKDKLTSKIDKTKTTNKTVNSLPSFTVPLYIMCVQK